MPQIINTNIASLNSQRNLDQSSGNLAISLQRLSSGLRINSAKDDAAGLAIATRFTSGIQGLTVARRNANDAISLSQVAEGALQETTRILQRARELSIQSANGSNSAADRKALQSEVNQLKQELTRIATTTTFNGLQILNGDLQNTEFQIGAEANQTVNVTIADTRTTAIGANQLTTNNTDGIEQATYLSFIGGGTNTDAAGVGTDIGRGSDNNGENNGYAATTFTVTNTTSAGVTNTDTSVTTTADDDAATIAANLSGVSGVTATGFNQIVISDTAQADTNDELRLSISGSGADATAVIFTGDSVEFSFMAEQINSNTDFSNVGVYAVATSSNVTVYATQGQDFVLDASSGGAGLAVSAQSGFREAATSVDLTTSNTSVTFGGRVDIQLDQGYTIAADDTGLLGGTAAQNITATASGLADVTAGNSVAAQTLTISGSSGTSTVDIVADEEASAIVTKVNAASGTTNVKASAITTLNMSNLSTDGTVTFDLFGDNTSSAPASISSAITTADFTALVQSINDAAGNTGITAATDGANNVIKLTHQTGKDIQIKNFTHSSGVDFQSPTSDNAVAGDGSSIVTATEASLQITGNSGENAGTTVTLYDGGNRTGLDSTVVGGQVTFTSSASFSVSSSIDGAGFNGSLFSGIASSGNSSTATTVNTIDIGTAAGAQSAISILDEAIGQVSEIRADLGAVQSRFESAIRNLSNSIENLFVSRSRILDTDFAAETASLTKNQILSQAGVSILAQANSLPQNVLALLQ